MAPRDFVLCTGIQKEKKNGGHVVPMAQMAERLKSIVGTRSTTSFLLPSSSPDFHLRLLRSPPSFQHGCHLVSTLHRPAFCFWFPRSHFPSTLSSLFFLSVAKPRRGPMWPMSSGAKKPFILKTRPLNITLLAPPPSAVTCSFSLWAHDHQLNTLFFHLCSYLEPDR